MLKRVRNASIIGSKSGCFSNLFGGNYPTLFAAAQGSYPAPRPTSVLGSQAAPLRTLSSPQSSGSTDPLTGRHAKGPVLFTSLVLSPTTRFDLGSLFLVPGRCCLSPIAASKDRNATVTLGTHPPILRPGCSFCSPSPLPPGRCRHRSWASSSSYGFSLTRLGPVPRRQLKVAFPASPKG